MKVAIPPKRFALVTALLAGFTANPALAHEGHSNTVLHAFLHLLQEPDHLLLLAAAGVVIVAAWRFFKGEKK
jgi:hydrogenase/urease accessory protein HupE